MRKEWPGLLVLLILLGMTMNLSCNEPKPLILAAGAVSPFDSSTVLVVFSQSLEREISPNHFHLDGKNLFASARQDEVASNLVYLSLMDEHLLKPDHLYELEFIYPNQNTESTRFKFANIESAAQSILNRQLPDGAIEMHPRLHPWKEGDEIWICPYFAHYAAQGLLYAHALQPDPAYLDAVFRWIQWYALHMQQDGTVYDYKGAYPHYASTGHYDSSDSYAACFLILVNQYLKQSADSNLLNWVYPYVQKAVGALELTLEPDWLTWGKPDWLIKYTMDNSEVWMGFDAAADLALRMEDAIHETWRETSRKVRQAVRNDLYLGDEKGIYSIGKAENDTLIEGWKVWYPDGMAQCFALAYVLEASDPRAQIVWNNTVEKFAPDYIPDPGVDFFFTDTAIKMGNKRLADIGYVITLQKKLQRDFLHEAGYVLYLAHYLKEQAE